jgi:drug/metabolite transporter (DMT)-like permease
VIVSAESVFGAAGAAMFLGERLSTAGVVGATIVLGAIVFLASFGQDSGAQKSVTA